MVLFAAVGALRSKYFLGLQLGDAFFGAMVTAAHSANRVWAKAPGLVMSEFLASKTS